MERVGDLKLVFPPGVFSQANPFTARKLYEHVYALAGLQGGETVLDLYCGVGPMALLLAEQARQVWAIDESEQAIATAKQNARRNGRGNCRFIAGDVATAAAQLQQTCPRSIWWCSIRRARGFNRQRWRRWFNSMPPSLFMFPVIRAAWRGISTSSSPVNIASPRFSPSICSRKRKKLRRWRC